MTLFRVTALTWVFSGIVRPLMFVTDAFGFGSAAGSSLPAAFIGAAFAIAIGLWLWRRPGRGSALAAVLFGFYIVPSLWLIQMLGAPGWVYILGPIGLVAFGLSLACAWSAWRPRPRTEPPEGQPPASIPPMTTAALSPPNPNDVDSTRR